MTQKLHIPITKQDEVKSSSTGSGMVTAVTWNPDVGHQQAKDSPWSGRQTDLWCVGYARLQSAQCTAQTS